MPNSQPKTFFFFFFFFSLAVKSAVEMSNHQTMTFIWSLPLNRQKKMPNYQTKKTFSWVIAIQSAVKCQIFLRRPLFLVRWNGKWSAGTLMSLAWPTGWKGCRPLSLFLGSWQWQLCL